MRKRILAISLSCLALGVLIAVLVMSCAQTPVTTTQGTIDVKATLDGSPWPSSGTGAVSYTLTGPGAASPISGTSVPTTHSNLDPGSWTCAYVSGEPAGASFVNITTAATQSLSAGSTITFTLNFVTTPPVALDHFMCYWVGEDMVLPELPRVVYLEDQFCALEVEVWSPWGFFNPAEKWHDGVLTPISNPDHHLLACEIYYEGEPQTWSVEVNNQFGTQSLIVSGPVGLAVPTQKVEPGDHEPPVGLDHFMVYDVIEGPQVNVVVGLNDQFGDQPEVHVSYPAYFFTPVKKTDENGIVTEIQNRDGHLVSYDIWEKVFYLQVQVVNQFGEYIFPNMEGPYCCTVPSQKISWEKQ